MEKIKKISRRFRVLFQIIFYLTPIGVLGFWLVFKTPYDFFSQLGISSAFLLNTPVTIHNYTRAPAFIVTMLPAGIMMYGLRQLIKLFKNYELGQIFTLDNVNYYRKLGYTLFAWVFAGVIYSMLISFIISIFFILYNPPYHNSECAWQRGNGSEYKWG